MTECDLCRYPHEGETCPNPACRVNVGEALWSEREAARAAELADREFRQRMWAISVRREGKS